MGKEASNAWSKLTEMERQRWKKLARDRYAASAKLVDAEVNRQRKRMLKRLNKARHRSSDHKALSQAFRNPSTAAIDASSNTFPPQCSIDARPCHTPLNQQTGVAAALLPPQHISACMPWEETVDHSNTSAGNASLTLRPHWQTDAGSGIVSVPHLTVPGPHQVRFLTRGLSCVTIDGLRTLSRTALYLNLLMRRCSINYFLSF